jgi:hypothetical protein
MAWFENFYRCDACDAEWGDEWSCIVDDECPICGARDMVPYGAQELTFLVMRQGDVYVVFRSPGTAEHTPDYEEIGEFSTRELADAYAAEAYVNAADE